MASQLPLIILATSIFLGVVFPSLATLVKPLLFPTIFLLFFFAVLQVRFADAVRAAFRERACSLILLWQLVVLPALAVVLLQPVLRDHWYLFAVVTLCTSSITATTALAKIFNLNDALALSVCVLGTLLMPVPLYIVLQLISGVDAQINLSVYASRIVVFIVIPFVLVWGLRRVAPASLVNALMQHSPSVVLFLLMIFGLSVMDGVRAMIHHQPLHLLSLVLLAFAISLFVQLITYHALKLLGVCDAKTACLVCAYRNMGLVAAITGPALGEYFLIFVGVWQLPMYTLPLVMQRWYRMPAAQG